MKKLSAVILIVLMSVVLFGCGDYTSEEGVALVKAASTETQGRDYTCTFTLSTGKIKPMEGKVLNTTDFDMRTIDYEVRYDADTKRYYEKAVDGDAVTERTYTAADAQDSFVGRIMWLLENSVSEDVSIITAVKRGKKDIIRYYFKELDVIDDSKPYEEAVSKKEMRLIWANMASMDTETVNATIEDGTLILVEYYAERVEQRVNPLSTTKEKVGIVTDKTFADLNLVYGDVTI